MAIERVKVALSGEEYQALLKLCEAELRPIDDQIRFLVARELRRRKLLVAEQGGEAAACSA